MKPSIFFATLLLSLFPDSLAISKSRDLILPWKHASGSIDGTFNVALIFMGNSEIRAGRYAKLMNSMQTLFHEKDKIQTWIGVLDTEEFRADPGTPQQTRKINDRIEETLNKLELSMNKNSRIKKKFARWILIGHSDGALFAQQWLQSTESKLTPDAFVLLGSSVLRQYRWDYGGSFAPHQKKIPYLTVGGDLDGVHRVTRLAESFVHQLIAPRSIDERGKTIDEEVNHELILKQAVIVLPEFSHISFVGDSSVSSPLIEAFDLRSPLVNSKSISLLSVTIYHFLNYHVFTDLTSSIKTKEISRSRILDDVKRSAQRLQPLVEAMLLESSEYLQSPCGDLNDKDPFSVKSPCWIGNHWTELMQVRSVVGDPADIGSLASKKVNFTILDEFHKSWIQYVSSVASSFP